MISTLCFLSSHGIAAINNPVGGLPQILHAMSFWRYTFFLMELRITNPNALGANSFSEFEISDLVPHNVRNRWIDRQILRSSPYHTRLGFATITLYSIRADPFCRMVRAIIRSEEHTSELQSRQYLVC